MHDSVVLGGTRGLDVQLAPEVDGAVKEPAQHFLHLVARQAQIITDLYAAPDRDEHEYVESIRTVGHGQLHNRFQFPHILPGDRGVDLDRQAGTPQGVHTGQRRVEAARQSAEHIMRRGRGSVYADAGFLDAGCHDLRRHLLIHQRPVGGNGHTGEQR